jgi:L-glutamine-phosphate cytidylyltransferase
MKAIILAAGMGTRLGVLTKDKPKAMLAFAGKTLLERQLDTLRAAGVTDIVVVKGYAAEKISYPGVRYYEDHSKTNMVTSLFAALAEMTDDFLISYGDVLYEPRVLKAVLDTPCEIGVTVDADYQDYWQSRLENPHDDQESMVIDTQGKITELGEPNPPEDKLQARYVGLIKVKGAGIRAMQEAYDALERTHGDDPAPWKFSRSWRRACMTDFLQALIDGGVAVTAIPIRRGWLEFDTVRDTQLYARWIAEGTMERFFHMA